MNKLEIVGEVIALDALRYTPAGIPLLGFRIKHISEQFEAEMKRKVECELAVVAMATLAQQANKIKIGSQLKLVGFLAKRSLKSQQLVLHINKFEEVNF